MRQLSLQDGPHSDDAWNETIMAAAGPGGITHTPGRRYAIEDAVQGQTSEQRIEDAEYVIFYEPDLNADRDKQQHGMAALAKIRAAAGSWLSARLIRETLRTQKATNLTNQVTLDLVECFARTDKVTYNVQAEVNQLSPHFQPWGLLKVKKHMPNAVSWVAVDEAISKEWHAYNPGERLAIIDDLITTGDLDRAAWRALNAVTPNHSPDAFNARREAFMKIVRIQARTDLQAALRLLEVFADGATDELNHLLQVGPVTTDNGKGIPANTSRRHDRYLDLHEAASETIALHAHRSAQLALQELSLVSVQDDSARDPQIQLLSARRAVIRGLADAGHTELALAQAMELPENREAREVKAAALIDIARAIHRRTVAANAGKTAATATTHK
jgi:hypothetical protein